MLEEKLEKGVMVTVQAHEKKQEDAPPWDTEKPAPVKEPPAQGMAPKQQDKPKTIPADASDPAARWPEIVNYVKSHGGMPIYPHLAMVSAKMSDGKFCVVFGDNALVSKTVVSKPGTLKLIQEAVKQVTGLDIEVACVTAKEIGDDSNDSLKKLEELSKTNSAIQFI